MELCKMYRCVASPTSYPHDFLRDRRVRQVQEVPRTVLQWLTRSGLRSAGFSSSAAVVVVATDDLLAVRRNRDLLNEGAPNSNAVVQKVMMVSWVISH